MKTEIILIGPHGAGKSTLGAQLALALGIPFHDEIGRRVAADPLARPPSRAPDDHQPDFDTRVIAEELARDAAWGLERGRVVETWHPGNLGFASLRSPSVVGRFLPEVRRSTCGRSLILVPLAASRETLERRRTEHASVAFFLEAARRAEAWARALEIPIASPIATDSMLPDAVLTEAVRALSLHGVAP